jgi:hypothetical protein
MIRLVYIAIILSLSTPLLAQPAPFEEPLSSRIANYVIDFNLRHNTSSNQCQPGIDLPQSIRRHPLHDAVSHVLQCI